MSALPSAAARLASETLRDDGHLAESSQRARQIVADRAVARARAQARPQDVEQRRTERLSVRELNELDADQIAQRLASVRYDDRSGVVKALDLLDLPRNALFNLVAPSLARKAELKADRRALGLPRVNFSDVLESLGVENRAAKAVLGFAGDVAFDPLTYVGGAGFGLRVASKAGAGRTITVDIGKRGRRALLSAAKETATGGRVRNQTARNLIEVSGFTPERVARLRRTVKPEDLEGAILKRVLGPVTTGRVGRFLAPVGADMETAGGVIGRRFVDQAPAGSRAAAQTDAVRGFVGEFGRANAPGLRIGGGGSQVLHVPFTELGVQVPAFTATGRTALAARAISQASSADELRIGGNLSRADMIARNLESLANEARDTFNAQSGEIDTLRRLVDEAPDPLTAGARQQALDARLDAYAAASAARAQRIEQLAEEARTIHVGPADRVNRLEDALALSRVRDVAIATADRARKLAAVGQDLATRDELLRGVSLRQQDATDTIRRLESFEELGETGAFLRVSNRGDVLVPADPNTLTVVSERVRTLLDELDSVRARIPTAQRAQSLIAQEVARDSAAELQKRAATLRRMIFDETAPLRDAPEFRTLDEAAQAIAESERARHSDFQRSLMDIPDDEADALRQQVDAATAAIASARRLADMTDAAMTPMLTDVERDVLEAVKVALGTNDDVIGSSLMAPFGQMRFFRHSEDNAAIRFAEHVDRSMAHVFGRRSGLAHRAMRMFERGMRQDAQRAFSTVANDFGRRVYKAADEYQVPKERRDEVYALATAMLYRRLADAAPEGFYTGVWVDGVGEVPIAAAAQYGSRAGRNAFMELDAAQSSGLLADRAGLSAALEPIADDADALLRELGDYAESEEFLRTLMSQYVPNVPTAQAQRAMGMTRGAFPGGIAPRGAGGDATALRESFQRGRTTTQYRFRGADGTPRRFFEFERAYLDYPPEQLSEAMRNVVRTIEEYDRLPNPPPGRPTDVFELNDLVAKGRFAPLTGSAPLSRGFFETNIAALLGTRVASQQRAMARAAFTEWVDTQGVSVRADELQRVFQSPPGTVTHLPDGRAATVTTPVKGQPAVRIGDTLYRKLDPSVVDPATNPVANGFGDAAATRLFPEYVADHIERASSVWSDQNTGELLQALDQLTGWWKSTTLLHPSWMLTEMVGNMTLWVQGGVRLRDVMRVGRFVTQVVWHENNPEALRKLSITIRGQTITGEELLAQARAHGITDASQGSELAAILTSRLFLKMPRTGRTRGSAKMAAANDALTMEQTGAKTTNNADHPFHESTMRRLIAPWFRADRKLNDSMRIMAYLSFLEQGDAPAQAAQRTLRAMFDYTDLTRTESGVLRRVFPFLSWMRNNTFYQVRQLFERPVYAANFPRLREYAEEVINGEDNVPAHMRPQWMRDMMALQIGRDPEKRWGVLLRNAIPFGEGYEALSAVTGPEGLQDFMNYFVSSVNPVMRTPVELGARREFFSGREIGVGEGDISPQQHLLQQFRPFREFGVGGVDSGPIQRSFDQGLPAGLGRLIAGGRSQPMSDERLRRQLLFEHNTTARNIRSGITRAEAAGDHTRSLRLRLRLLAVYRQMIESGLESEVPLWARTQIEQATPQGVE